MVEQQENMVEVLNPGKEDICTYHKMKNRHIRVKAGLGVISQDDAVLFADWLHQNKCLIGDEIKSFHEYEDNRFENGGDFGTPHQFVNVVKEREKLSVNRADSKNAGETMLDAGNKAKQGGRKARSSGDPGNPDSKNEGKSGDVDDVNAGNIDDNLRRPMSSESFENGNPNPDSEANNPDAAKPEQKLDGKADKSEGKPAKGK